MTTTSKLGELFATAAAAAVAETKAHDKARVAAGALFESDVRVADISRGGKHLALMQESTARRILTDQQVLIWANGELAMKQRVKDETTGKMKQVNTKRGLLVDRVNGVVRTVRNHLASVEAAGGLEKATRGARGKNSSPTEAFFKAIDGCIKRLSKDNASDAFDFDPRLARKLLVQLVKELK